MPPTAISGWRACALKNGVSNTSKAPLRANDFMEASVVVIQGGQTEGNHPKGTIEQPVRRCQSHPQDLFARHGQVLQEVEVSGWRQFQVGETAVVNTDGF